MELNENLELIPIADEVCDSLRSSYNFMRLGKEVYKAASSDEQKAAILKAGRGALEVLEDFGHTAETLSDDSEDGFVITKGWGADLMSKYPGAKWVTINGSHVLIVPTPDEKGGHIVAGNKKLVGRRLSAVKTEKEMQEAKREAKARKLERMTGEERKQVKEAAKQYRETRKEIKRKKAEKVQAALGDQLDQIKEQLEKDFERRTERAEREIKELTEKKIENLHETPSISAEERAEKIAQAEQEAAQVMEEVKKEFKLEAKGQIDIATDAMVDTARQMFNDLIGVQMVGEGDGTRVDRIKDKRLRSIVEKLAGKIDADTAREIVKAEQEAKAAQKQLRKEKKKWEAKRTKLDTAMNLATVGVTLSDEELAQVVSKDAANLSDTRAAMEFYGGERGLNSFERSAQKHLTDGAMSAMNAVASEFIPGKNVSADVVKILGVEGAAMVMAHQLQQSGKKKEAIEKLSKHHEETHMQHIRAALSEAKDIEKNIEMNNALGADGTFRESTVRAYNMHERTRQQEIVGSVAGALEASSALISHLENPQKEFFFNVSPNPEIAERQLTGLGLEAGDYYNVKSKTGRPTSTYAIKAETFDKLVKINNNLAKRDAKVARIKAGLENEKGWKPEGAADKIEVDVKDAKGKVIGKKWVKWEIKDSQQRMIRFAEAQKRVVWNAQAGIGKTLAATALAKDLINKGKIKKSIIMVPAQLRSEYNEDVAKFFPTAQQVKKSDMPHSVNITGDDQAAIVEQSGLRAKYIRPGLTQEQKQAIYNDPNIDMVIISHEEIKGDVSTAAARKYAQSLKKTPKGGISKRNEYLQSLKPEDFPSKAAMDRAADEWVIDQTQKYKQEMTSTNLIDKAGFGLMVIDETHKMVTQAKEAGSQREREFKKLQAEYMVGMSGTPVRNNIRELAKLVDAINPGYMDVNEFTKRYDKINNGGKVFADAEIEGFRRELDNVMITEKMEIPAKLRKYKEDIDPSAETRTKVKEVMDNYHNAMADPEFTYAREDNEGNKVLVRGKKGAAARRDHDLYRALLNGDHKTNAVFQKMVQNIEATDPSTKHVIHLTYDSAKNTVIEGLRAKYGKDAVVAYTGKESLGQRKKNKKAFNTDSKVRFIVANTAGSTGINLQKASHHTHHYDIPDTAAEMMQREARNWRTGQDRDVHSFDYVSTVPQHQRKVVRVKRKRNLQNALGDPGAFDSGVFGEEIKENVRAA